ncbi:hypothetical protein IKB17_01525 [bacterium]|nr:hypothetical protein [bacterium]
MDVNRISQNQTSFRAKLDLIADKRCLPKGATKRLTKLAQTIGINTDTITIGVSTRGTNKTIVRENLLGCRYKDQVAGSLDTYIATMATSPSKKLHIPFVEKIIPGTKYPNAIAKYFNSKEIKMNNYKEIYRYMLDLRDKFKPTV